MPLEFQNRLASQMYGIISRYPLPKWQLGLFLSLIRNKKITNDKIPPKCSQVFYKTFNPFINSNLPLLINLHLYLKCKKNCIDDESFNPNLLRLFLRWHSEALQRMESFSITSFPLRITLDNFFRNVLFSQTPPLKQLVCYHRPMSHHKIRFQQIVGSRQKDFLQVSHVNWVVRKLGNFFRNIIFGQTPPS